MDIGGARHQPRAVGIGSRDQHRGHAQHIGGKPGGHQFRDEHGRGHQHLAAHVPALLGGSQLILKVHAGGTGRNHRLHQFESVQRSAEARFGIGDDRSEPVRTVAAFAVVHLIGAHERRC